MFDYAKSAATAERLLTRFGQTGAIRRTTRSGGGPADPTGGTETAEDTPARLVVLPVDLRDVDGTIIRTGDWRVIVEALPFAVTTADRIVCTEGELAIIDTGRIAPAGTTVVYDMRARG